MTPSIIIIMPPMSMLVATSDVHPCSISGPAIFTTTRATMIMNPARAISIPSMTASLSGLIENEAAGTL